MRALYLAAGLSHAALKLIYHRHPQDTAVACLAQQAEAFGRGFFNDPIKNTDAIYKQSKRMLLNFDALKQSGVETDFQKHWLVAHAFQLMNDKFSHGVYGTDAIEHCLQTGTSCPLAVTPLADLMCLGPVEPLLQMYVNQTDIPQLYVLQQIRLFAGAYYATDNTVHPTVNLPETAITYDFNAMQDICGFTSMDGNMTDEYVSNPQVNFTRQHVVDLLIRMFECLKDNVNYLTYIRTQINGVLHYTCNNVAHTHQMHDNNVFVDINSMPNLFFLWVLRTVWTDARLIDLDLAMSLKNVALSEMDRSILLSANDYTPQGNAIPAQFAIQMTNSFHAAHCQQTVSTDDLSIGKVMIATMLRATLSLLKLFDIPRMAVNGNGVLSQAQGVHKMASDCMVMAAIAHVLYRETIKQEALYANARDFGSGVPQTVTRTECLKNSMLVTVCSTPLFQNNVLYFEETNRRLAGTLGLMDIEASEFNNNCTSVAEALAPYLWTSNAYGYRQAEFVFANGAQPAHVFLPINNGRRGRLYWQDWQQVFVEQMASGHPTVQRTHNVVVQTSQSGGANISQFPNYHLSRCTPLCDADRVRSASSENEALWIVQQLAGAAELSGEVCGRMMGIQANVSNTVVQQCAELMGSSQVLHERPTVSGTPAVIVPIQNPAFDGTPEHRVKPALGGSGDKYWRNLMLAMMAHFHPGLHVQQELGPYAHVPVHVQKMVMLAFADAIEQNATQTPQLEEALRELFTEADQHVPLCALPASTDFTMMPRLAADLHQFNGLLTREVRWDQVPIAHGESFWLATELQAEREARLLHDLVWDPYEEEFSSYAGRPACVLMEGPGLQQMHPMRSFSPQSIARGANAAAGAP